MYKLNHHLSFFKNSSCSFGKMTMLELFLKSKHFSFEKNSMVIM